MSDSSLARPLVSLSADCDLKLLGTDTPSQRTIRWRLSANHASPSPATTRPPLNLALVLDRSGSMHGEKLYCAAEAAARIVDQLSERDRLCVVTFDDEVRMLASGKPLTDQRKREIRARLKAVQSGGSTNLSGGWLRGCMELAEKSVPGGISRSFLLTDGQANRGITNAADLEHHAAELCARGVSTTTFGVGLDFDENLLTRMALRGGGHFYYVARPDEVIPFFRQEFGELAGTVARQVRLGASAPAGWALELLGNLPHTTTPGGVTLSAGDMFAGQELFFYARILAPASVAGATAEVAASVMYVTPDEREERVAAPLVFTYASAEAISAAAPDREILAGASALEVTTVAEEALRLERLGERERAASLMRERLASSAPDLSELDYATFGALASDLSQGLSEPEHKSWSYEFYRTRASRKR